MGAEHGAESLVRWTRGDVAPPTKLDVYLTNRCNLLCQFCHYPFLPSHRYQGELSHEELLAIVRGGGEMGVKVLGMLGGEPFLRKETALQMMALAKKYRMSGAIVTNGTLLREEDLRPIIGMQWDLMRISLDGSRADTHDKLRGVKGSFDMTLRTVSTLQSLKRKEGLSHPTLELNMVLTRRNVDDLAGMIRLSSEHGINRIYVLPVIEFGKDISHLKFREQDGQSVVAHIKEAEAVSKEMGITSNLGTIRDGLLFSKSNAMDTVLLDNAMDSEIPCFFPWHGMSIDAQGWVTPCGQIETPVRINIRDYGSLSAAWTSQYFMNLREKMLNSELPKGCERCCMPLMDDNTMLRRELESRGVQFGGGQWVD